jgi:hypothetical protein
MRGNKCLLARTDHRAGRSKSERARPKSHENDRAVNPAINGIQRRGFVPWEARPLELKTKSAANK